MSPEREYELVINEIRLAYIKSVAVATGGDMEAALKLFLTSENNEMFSLWTKQVSEELSTVAPFIIERYWKGEEISEKLKSKFTSLVKKLQSKYETDMIAGQFEIMAIKPGFHEAWWLEDHEKLVPNEPTNFREMILKSNYTGRRHIPRNLKRADVEYYFKKINFEPTAILSYAPCFATDGPLHRKKNHELSYRECCLIMGSAPRIHTRELCRIFSDVYDYIEDLLNGIPIIEVVKKMETFIKGENVKESEPNEDEKWVKIIDVVKPSESPNTQRFDVDTDTNKEEVEHEEKKKFK